MTININGGNVSYPEEPTLSSCVIPSTKNYARPKYLFGTIFYY